MSSRPIILTGCSGAGKSSTLAELACAGYQTLPEAGRRVVETELASGGEALPWKNPLQFVEKAVETCLNDLSCLDLTGGTSFTDRSLIDLIAFLVRSGITVPGRLERLLDENHYSTTAFIYAPWPHIYKTDMERRHDFDEARREYEHLIEFYGSLGFNLVQVPQAPIEARVRFILDFCGHSGHLT
ncbi:AAA family ATPase [Roseibium sp. RKSG952]|uniref:AAA family ATPase n=1 Tax=Roseibium sp. RKSG952 TaxID=2529384 RepID=UPI0012BB8AAC|nr:AAA family ATPase [Roseibium sp. RKSG952]MTH98328.1 ATPase [Roseibium sp. RKSG952]